MAKKRTATAVERAVPATVAALKELKAISPREARDLMRTKLEAIMAPLDKAARSGKVDILDYATFLARFSVGDKASAVEPPINVKRAVIMLPQRNPPPSQAPLQGDPLTAKNAIDG